MVRRAAMRALPTWPKGTLFDKVKVENTIGTTEALTPEAVATMIVQLGSSVQAIAGKLDIPDGIPLVRQAVSGLVDFSKMTQDFARQLYFNPKLVGVNDISITNGRLSQDATFVIRIEGGDPLFVTIPASATATNNSIDDLYADINAVLAQPQFEGRLIAERQLPLSGSQVVIVTNVTATAVAASVAPLPAGYSRFRADLHSSIDLFNLGIRVGSVIEYRDTFGLFQKATVDEMLLSSLSFPFQIQSDAPDTDAARSIALFGSSDTNKLAIRTTSPTAGISLELSTVQLTAPNAIPNQLNADLTLALIIDGKSTNVTITAASTRGNGQPSDMLEDVQSSFGQHELWVVAS